MANVHIPVNPYDVGVRLNSTPYVNIFIRQQQQKRANEQAFDASIADMQKNVTPAGMRTVDVENFTNESKKWMDFGIQNKNEIQHPTLDGGQKRNEFMGRHQDLLALAASSKGESGKWKDLQSIRNNPNQMALVDDATREGWRRSNLPTSSPEFQPLDPNAIGFNEKPLEINDRLNYVKYLMEGVSTKRSYGGVRPDPNNPLGNIQLFKYDHTPETIAVIANKAASSYESSGRVKKDYVERFHQIMPKPNEFNHNQIDPSPEFDIYNNRFKQISGGKNIETAKDLAIADALIITDNHSIEEVPVANMGAAIDKRFQNSLTLKTTKGAGSAGSGGGNGNGKKNTTTDFVQRYKTAAESGDANKMTDILSEMRAGNGKMYIPDGGIDINLKDKGVRLNYHPLFNDGTPNLEEKKQVEFKLSDPNVYSRLASFFQQATGSNAKLEGNIFGGKSDITNPQATKPKQSPVSSGNVHFEYDGKQYEQSPKEYLKTEQEAKKAGAKIKRLN